MARQHMAENIYIGKETISAIREVVSVIEGMKGQYNEVARYIWDHPELGLVEGMSSARLCEFLATNGFRIAKNISGMPTAFMATYGMGKPVIGFLAEFDALPNLSQQAGIAIPKPIIPGAPGHGCGHNLIGTSSATAAIAAAKVAQKLGIKGTIQVFGTPAEEVLIGKLYMCKDGIFDGADAIMSWHPRDTSGVDYNTLMAMKSAKFKFYGRSAHTGTDPEHGRSALSAAELMNIGVNFMREHVTREATINYIISKGGEAPNNVPAFAENYYYIRAPRFTQVEQIWNWLMDIGKGAALMTQTRMTYGILSAVYEKLPNRTLSQLGEKVINLIGPPPFNQEDQQFGKKILKSLGKKIKGEAFNAKISVPDFTCRFPQVPIIRASNDQGNVSWKIPLLDFGITTQAKGSPNHSWQMVSQTGSPPAFKAGLQVSKWLAGSALALLNERRLIRNARKELNGYIHEFGVYRDPMPANSRVPTFEELYGMKPNAVPGMIMED